MALPATIADVDQISRGALGRGRPYKGTNDAVYLFWRGTLAGEGDEFKAYKSTDPATVAFTEQDFVQEDGSSSWSNMGTFREDDSDDEIHFAQGQGGELVFYHIFDMSTDTFTTENEAVTSAVQDDPFGSKTMAIALETGGDVIIVYQGAQEDNMGLVTRVDYARRVGGTWTSNIAVDDGGKVNYHSGGLVRGASNLFHITYHDETNLDALHKSVQDVDGTLSSVEILNDTDTGAGEHMVVNPVYYDDGGVERITVAWKRSTGDDGRSAEIDDDGTPAAAETFGISVDAFTESSFTWAQISLAVDVKTVWAIWAQASDNDLFINSNVNSGGWGTEAEEADGVTANAITSNIYERDGNIVLAYLYDDGGTVTYDEFIIRAAVIDIQAEGGSYTHVGVAAGLEYHSVVIAGVGSYLVSGAAVDFFEVSYDQLTFRFRVDDGGL